ncbi:MAG: bifunctional riboflavin kinase/FAD synthetase [Tuberibacillus sp.]
MEVIHLTQAPEQNNEDQLVLALGYFDGVHIGHQKVIKTAVEIAREKGIKAAVMTFHPHPSVVLKQMAKREDYLTPPEEKAKLIKELGVDILYFVKFDQAFSQLSPQDFIDKYVIGLNVKHVVAGFDFTYGRMAKGNMENMEEYSRNMFAITTIPKVTVNQDKVSTTKIRELVQAGHVGEVESLLGRQYRIKGMVVHGDKRGGSVLGFPTANVKTHDPYVFPDTGIYIVRMVLEQGVYNGAGYIGTRPTFYENEKNPVIEVFLFDFDGNIYGETVAIEWLERIRGDMKFDSVEELIEQMNKDIEKAKNYFQKQ